MKKYVFLIVLVCGGMNVAHAAVTATGTANGVAAVDLFTVYQQALRSDPVLAEAEATRAANQEGVPQSRAGLLPTLASTGSVIDTRNSEQDNAAQGARNNAGNQHSYGLTLSQPIFNFQSWMQLRAAKASAKQADATYNAALQSLILRVSTTYFNVLQAQDNLRFIKAQKEAVNDQLKQIKERYQVGMATMTDVYQAQANYDALNAQEISAENTVMNSFEALQQITGVDYTALASLKARFSLRKPNPENAQQWILAGEANNWTLLAAKYAEQAAKENIRVNYAGHFPVVSATGAYNRGNGAALGLDSPSTAWSSQVGVQVSFPLYQGGLVLSKTRQAQDQYLAASDRLEATHRQVIFQTQEAFNNVVAGISKVKADRIAVTSAQSALESTQAGYKAGTKTILDVLTAEQNLYQAQATLSSDQYTYILNTLALKQASGSLNATDVLAINRWLKHERV